MIAVTIACLAIVGFTMYILLRSKESGPSVDVSSPIVEVQECISQCENWLATHAHVNESYERELATHAAALDRHDEEIDALYALLDKLSDLSYKEGCRRLQKSTASILFSGSEK